MSETPVVQPHEEAPLPPPPPVLPPAQQAMVEIDSRRVTATGFFPAGSINPALEVMDLDAYAWSAFQSAPEGDKYLAPDGRLTVVPPAPDLAGQRQARITAEATAQATLLALENPDYLVILSASGGI